MVNGFGYLFFEFTEVDSIMDTMSDASAYEPSNYYYNYDAKAAMEAAE